MIDKITREISKRSLVLKLPLIVTSKNKWIILIAATILVLHFYLIPNHYPLFNPLPLPMTWIDLATPFIPHSVWVYSSIIPLILVSYISVKNEEVLNRFAYGFVAMWIFSSFVFLLYPTTFPRGDFPLPLNLDPWTRMLFEGLRVADSPANCAPSLHVSSSFFCAFIFLAEGKKKFPWVLAWASAISYSTLTTKQHYFVDVATGLMIAMFFYWIAFKKLELRNNGFSGNGNGINGK